MLFTYLWCSLPFPVSDIQICTSPLQSFCLCTFTISSCFMPVLLYCFKIHLNGTDFPRLTSFFFLQQFILQVQLTRYRYPLLSDYKPKNCITVFVFFFSFRRKISFLTTLNMVRKDVKDKLLVLPLTALRVIASM